MPSDRTEPLNDSRRKARCPYCAKLVGLTKTGKLYTHNDPATGNRCGRSGGRPN